MTGGMLKMDAGTQWIRNFFEAHDGLTTVEYAIAGGVVGAAVIVAFVVLGGDVGAVIAYVDQQLCGSNPGC
jgi:pilus assembly protein Flp/PilA